MILALAVWMGSGVATALGLRAAAHVWWGLDEADRTAMLATARRRCRWCETTHDAGGPYEHHCSGHKSHRWRPWWAQGWVVPPLALGGPLSLAALAACYGLDRLARRAAERHLFRRREYLALAREVAAAEQALDAELHGRPTEAGGDTAPRTLRMIGARRPPA